MKFVLQNKHIYPYSNLKHKNMAIYKAYDEKVEVNGQTILSFVNGTQSSFQKTILGILADHGIESPEADKWYPQQHWLDAFKTISEKVGSMTLMSIGKAIPESAVFPPQIDNLETALSAIDMAYNMNHRGGNIGHYKLEAFDVSKRKATMVCENPYPDAFNQGIITSMAKRFKPKEALFVVVEQDKTKPSRDKGDERSHFNISW